MTLRILSLEILLQKFKLVNQKFPLNKKIQFKLKLLCQMTSKKTMKSLKKTNLKIFRKEKG